MPRRPQGWWSEQRKCYLARLGEISPTTGKPKPVVLYDPHGRKIRKGNHRAVAAAISCLLDGRDDRIWVGPTIADICGAFVRWCVEQGRSPLTIKGHDENLRRWCRLIGPTTPAAAIAPEHVWAWRRAGWGHYRQAAQSVKAAWSWAAKPIEGRVPTRLLKTNPLAGLPVPPSRPQAGRALPWETSRLILRLAWSHGRQRAGARIAYTRASRRLKWLALAVIAWTGLRTREAWGLRWDEWTGEGFRPDPARIKTRRFRPAPVPPRLAKLIEGMRPIADEEYCFLPAGWRHRKPADIHLLWDYCAELREWMKGRGYDLPRWTPYSLRHGFFSDAVGMAGIDADTIALAGGNSGPVVRQRYLDAQVSQVRRTNERLWAARRKRG